MIQQHGLTNLIKPLLHQLYAKGQMKLKINTSHSLPTNPEFLHPISNGACQLRSTYKKCEWISIDMRHLRKKKTTHIKHLITLNT